MTNIRKNHTFTRIEIPSDSFISDHSSRIIKAEVIQAANRQKVDLRNSQLLAKDIVAEAHEQAAEILKSAIDEAEDAYQTRVKSIDSEISNLLDQVSDNLGDALATCVEAIYRYLFNREPSLLLEATLQVAREVLEQEAGNVLHVNVSDLEHEALTALTNRFVVQSNSSVPPGTVHIRGDDGETRVDAAKFIRDLGQDLRECFQHVGTLSLPDRGNP